MSKALRIVIYVLAVFGFAQLAMLALFFVGPHVGSGCAAYPVMEVPSPTTAYLATVENNTCTPSHELQTIVFVSDGPSTKTSVFMAPSALRDAGSYSPLPLKLTWLGDAQLQVEYPRGVEGNYQETSVGNVNVVYKQFAHEP